MKPAKKKPTKKSSKSKSLSVAPLKKKATSKKPIRAAKRSQPVTAKVKLSENGTLKQIQTENLRLSGQLKKRERELEIEAALEKVRARTMAMQQSDELLNAADVLFEQVELLGVTMWNCGFNIWDDDKRFATAWMGTKVKALPFRTPSSEDVFLRIYEAEQRGESLYVEEMGGEALEEHYRFMIKLPILRDQVEDFLASGISLPTRQIVHCAFFSQGYLMFITYESVPEAHTVFKRFAKVFEQTYTRFLDLQKAEAQARESQIQLAMERIRARTMAMQRSEELADAAQLLFKQVKELGVHTWTSGFQLWDEDRKAVTVWTSTEGVMLPPFKIPATEDPLMINISAAEQKGETLYVEEMGGEVLESHYRYMFSLPALQEVFRKVAAEGHAPPTFQINHAAYFSHGYLLFITYEPVSEAHDIFKRFAKVFEQTYTRFLDLQKAEAQGREAQIEAALERVRSRTMAMQRSEELADVATVLFQQVKAFGVPQLTCGFSIFEIDDKEFTWYPGSPDGDILTGSKIPLTEHPVFIQFNESRKRGDELCIYEKTGEIQADHYRYMLTVPSLIEGLQKMFDAGFSIPTFQIDHLANFSHGNLAFITYEPVPEMHDVFKRFAKVFEQTYTRFLDLKKAEAQAREAQIETALERVRSRSMGMQKSDELRDVIQLVFEQLLQLNFKIDSASFSLNYKESDDFNLWTAIPQRSYPVLFHIPYFDHPIFNGVKEAKATGINFFTDSFSFEEKNKFWRHFFDHSTTVTEERQKYVLNCPGFARSQVLMNTISLFILNYQDIPYSEAENEILKRFGKVFEQTYTRFLDLQKAEAQAREAQIEAALERIRARALAMQTSKDLIEVANVLRDQMGSLGQPDLESSLIHLYNDDAEDFEAWYAYRPPNVSSGEIITGVAHAPKYSSEWAREVIANYESSKTEYTVVASGEKIKEWYKVLEAVAPAVVEYNDHGHLVIPEILYYHFSKFSGGALLMISNQQPAVEVRELQKRAAAVFDLAFTRFLDLQKAEAQAREAKIEAALEKVRSRTMAMQRSEELADVASLLFQQVKSLGVPPWSCGFNIWGKEEKVFTSYMGNPNGAILASYKIPLTEEATFIHFQESRERGDKLWVEAIGGEALEAHYRYFTTLPGIKEVFEKNAEAGFPLPKFQINHLANFSHGNLLFITFEPCPEAHDIFIRFAAVFEQTYTRFLDLKKAEAQAREAQIENALEKVRSRTIGMQRSDELQDAAQLLFQQVHELGVHQWACGYNIWEEDKKACTAWMSAEGRIQAPFKTPSSEDVFLHFYDASLRDESLHVEEIGGEVCAVHYRFLSTLPGVRDIMKGWEAAGIAPPTFQVFHIAYFKQGYLMFITYDRVPEVHELFKRFAKVFEQTYTRFLDLQKAEAQAREAQIENALERVRSRTMAMQHSSEMAETSFLLDKQVRALGIQTWGCAFNIYDEDMPSSSEWFSNEQGNIGTYKTPREGIFLRYYEKGQKGETLHVEEIMGDECVAHYAYLCTLPVVGDILNKLKESGVPFPTSQIDHVAYFKYGYLLFITFQPALEAHDIFKRFAKVFEQTYTRFLDLQKAEAQAREAQIETALERVRSRSMGMQKSEELREIIQVIYEQFIQLGFNINSAGFAMDYMESDDFNFWLADSYSVFPKKVHVPYFDHPQFNRFKEAKEKGLDFYASTLTFEEKNKFFDHILKDLPSFPQEVKEVFYGASGYTSSHVFLKNVILLYILKYTDTPFSDAENATLMRFGKVFEQSYIRFNDLKQAEDQALEAIKRASVDRVRAEIASMRTTHDLERITPLIWSELTTLGVSFIRCGVFIMDDEQEQVQSFLSTPDGKAIAAFRVPYNAHREITQIIACWRNKVMYKPHWDEAAFIDWTKALMEHGAITSGEKYLTENRPTNLYLHFFPFLQGMLYVGNVTPLNDDELQLVQNLADAFSIAYARYEDFNKLESANVKIEKTLVDLKQTQAQLVQSEKMASLGELTAGIAHEIQNPLNFVNNFSEVNKELLAEIDEEIDKGNFGELKKIIKDVIGNEEKISHHGKRADAIVKGMLQHSRSSSGVKEPTDINALADEYLRLAYHGLRAKDKSFNATMNKDYDKSLEKIEVVPQDMGRVILNLITNAFYAITEKKKTTDANYEPTITVSTKGIGNQLTVSVKDNGNGIPQKVLDKIFQPFFTTKPTGQGTGLGLSLSYDIVKAHGGEFKVETKEGEGSEFIIQLPI